MNAVRTAHNLDFESRPWVHDENIQEFRVGTCKGQWFAIADCYCILSVINEKPGNGHFNDVLQWFSHSCKRDKKHLAILDLMNPRFKTHLIEKRGFIDIGNDNVIKEYSRL